MLSRPPRAALVVATLIVIMPVALRIPFWWIAGVSEDPIWVTSGLTLPGMSQIHLRPAGLQRSQRWTDNAGARHSGARMWMAGVVPWWDPYSGIGLWRPSCSRRSSFPTSCCCCCRAAMCC